MAPSDIWNTISGMFTDFVCVMFILFFVLYEAVKWLLNFFVMLSWLSIPIAIICYRIFLQVCKLTEKDIQHATPVVLGVVIEICLMEIILMTTWRVIQQKHIFTKGLCLWIFFGILFTGLNLEANQDEDHLMEAAMMVCAAAYSGLSMICCPVYLSSVPQTALQNIDPLRADVKECCICCIACCSTPCYRRVPNTEKSVEEDESDDIERVS